MRLIAALVILGASTFMAGAAVADPPERVGRVAYVEGDVALQPPQSDDWAQALVNFPAAEGEGFWTGDGGRVELQIGAVAARLDSETELDIDALRWGDMRLALAQGSVNIQVRGSPEGAVTVATPAGDVHLEGRGFYRIDVAAADEDGEAPPAEVTVFQGQIEAPSPEGYAPIYPGQAATLYAGYNPQAQEAEDSAIDDWSRGRIRAEYLPGLYALPEAMSGAADLARWGEFVETPEFGTVWFPRDVPPDWAPYRFGRWVDVAPWGYTWVDDAPWGFAPFHYGRWTSIDGRWAWIPGQPEPRPVYAPALVSFIGGGGWGAQFGAEGAIGWVPLGPGEVYRPTYIASDEFLRRLNAANVPADQLEARLRLPEAEHAGWRNAKAATIARADALARGEPIRQAVIAAPAEAVLAAPPATAILPPPPRPTASAPAPYRPPSRLRDVRQAIAAPPPRPGAPPPALAGRRPPPAGLGAGASPRLIAPAQRHDPAAQNRQPVMPAPSSEGAPPRAPRPPRSPPGETTPPPPPPPDSPPPEPARPPRHPPPRATPSGAAPAAPESPATHEGGKPASPPSASRPTLSPDAQAQARARAEARRKAAEAAVQPPPEPPPAGPPPH